MSGYFIFHPCCPPVHVPQRTVPPFPSWAPLLLWSILKGSFHVRLPPSSLSSLSFSLQSTEEVWRAQPVTKSLLLGIQIRNSFARRALLNAPRRGALATGLTRQVWLTRQCWRALRSLRCRWDPRRFGGREGAAHRHTGQLWHAANQPCNQAGMFMWCRSCCFRSNLW